MIKRMRRAAWILAALCALALSAAVVIAVLWAGVAAR